MTKETIAWVNNNRMYIESYIEMMREKGFGDKHHRTAGSAIDDFVGRSKYSLIVTDLQIAPGLDCTDSKIKEIMAAAPPRQNPNYWEVVLRMIELTRGAESVNKDTPIVVATIYHPTNDKLFPNAKETCLAT